MALYSVSIDAIALAAATAKSLFELASPATSQARIVQWWVEFDGVSASAVPVKIEVGRFSAAVTTATTQAGGAMDLADAGSLMTTKHSTTVEGAGTMTAGGEIHRVSPTSGILVQYPLGREWVIPISAFWRIRCTAAAIVNATFGCLWDE